MEGVSDQSERCRQRLAGLLFAAVLSLPTSVHSDGPSASIPLAGQLPRSCLVSITTGSGGLITGLLPILRNYTVLSINCNYAGASTLSILQKELQIPEAGLLGLVIEPLELSLFGGRSVARYRLVAQPSATTELAEAVDASIAAPGQVFTATVTPN